MNFVSEFGLEEPPARKLEGPGTLWLTNIHSLSPS